MAERGPSGAKKSKRLEYERNVGDSYREYLEEKAMLNYMKMTFPPIVKRKHDEHDVMSLFCPRDKVVNKDTLEYEDNPDYIGGT